MIDTLKQIGARVSAMFRRDPYGLSIDVKPRFFLQKWFERMVRHVTVPEDQLKSLQELAAKGGVCVYAMRESSQIDFVYVSMRLHQLGLPSPVFMFDHHPYLWQPRWSALKTLVYHLVHLLRHGGFPDPYAGGYYGEKIRAGDAGLFSLVGKRGYYRSTVLVGNDPLEHLLEIQKTTDRPIFIVPLVLFYNRRPEGRQRWAALEFFLGQKRPFGFLRKMISFVRGNPYAVMETGEPLNMQEILPELSEDLWRKRKQIFEFRRTLIDSIDEIKRAVVGPTMKSKLEMKEIILHHPRLETVMERRARTTSQEVWRVRLEADGYLEEIAATYNVTFIQIASKIFNWVWNNLFDGIEVDWESLQKVKRAARNHTLVYIPCHKSHMDYLLLSQLLYTNNLYAPFIAAGRNLAFWPLGPIFRMGGAFFIRRSFQGLKLYAEVFALYVKTMLQLGYNIEFFIEGGRSRTGKLVLPKLGLLGILIQAVEEGFCDDLVFVPTAICYDRIPEEESYLKEITGGAKEEENLGQLVSVRRVLRKRYGRAYLKFAEPISLKRYLERRNHDLRAMAPKERHSMYRHFAYRIINYINQESIVTAYALAASALLAQPRHGVSKAEFLEIARTLYGFTAARGVAAAKTMKNLDAGLQDSLRNMERGKLIGKLKDEDDDLEEEVFTLEDNKRLALEYYKNNIIHFLLPAAYVSTSILAQQTFRFSVSQVVEDVSFMKRFFKFEFVYDNELSDEKLVEDVLLIFENMGFLHRVGEGDQSFILAHQGLRASHAFHGLLRNYFEGYWLVLRGLRYLQKNGFSDKDFIKKILALGQKALKLGLVERPECVSKIIFDNALKLYIEKNIIIKGINGDKEKEVKLSPGTEGHGAIQLYSKQISYFLRSPHFVLQ
ncbi:MAG TPA: 1-acyl-sn-glycerol-3-phosphate acyltransferase [Syntrophobacteraceae bacterium]|nr:1-acyl-sn-glycerol-3-phosphate acyltransferase [Syntrophobacteraceae bacterium]